MKYNTFYELGDTRSLLLYIFNCDIFQKIKLIYSILTSEFIENMRSEAFTTK